MPIWTKFALFVAIVLGTAATASAATKSRKIAVPRSGPQTQAVVPRTAPFSNPYSAEATGGGNPGYKSKNPLLTKLAINAARTIRSVNSQSAESRLDHAGVGIDVGLRRIGNDQQIALLPCSTG
jgi:hypothetical protein